MTKYSASSIVKPVITKKNIPMPSGIQRSVTGRGAKSLGGAGKGTTFPNMMKGGKKPKGNTIPNVSLYHSTRGRKGV